VAAGTAGRPRCPLAKLLTLPMVVVLQFALNRRFTFQSAQAAPAN
jgi:putative flippase GtrA